MIPKTRLGKRSPFGALVNSTCTAAESHLETGKTVIALATMARQDGISRVKGHVDLKVYFQCGGAGESLGALDQPDPSAWSSSLPSSSSSSSVSPSSRRSVSSCIDVPRSGRSPQEVDMDELMAAMVLSSLSCSPPPQGSAHPDTAASTMDGCGELSDSGSSGYWSIGHTQESPAPSSPITEPDGGRATPPDEGLDMELDQVLFDEPAPRKRRNSLKVAYRCLWPSCGKILTSVVGIKRHIRTTHLCRGGEHERCSRSEEDFYYTEINQWDHPKSPSPPTSVVCGPAPTSPNSSPSSPPSPPSPASSSWSSLSRSAPSNSGSFWQVQSEHSYQAPPPSHMVSPAATPVCHLTAPPTTCSRQGVAPRVRSVSVGEQWLQHQSAPCRRIRSEAKKCRKVYGIEHRDQWCTACRWKKACQRFLD
ncbi:zinc finger protein 395-like [Melanotaenia boesemani]|uniref:zinc finger protein 395-like n=1 Tax=Melanotaenia boesemani TaxID=1250792 RepID=UPI001C03BE7F|nr:zinc finger protein 395-like [Melanotaenia boesemani]